MNWDKASIRAILIEASESIEGATKHKIIVYRGLQAIYAKQTADEQATEDTHLNNGMGFNGNDANWLSKVAAQSVHYKGLTPAQAKAVAKKIIKYSGQLAKIAEHKTQ